MYLFQDTYKPTTESYTLSLHDALPILEEAEHGITANMICPGDITGDMKESNIQMAKSIKDQKTPVGRPGSGGDIARLIDFLCQEDSDLITGSIIDGSGGIDVVNRKRS